jgi:hypothetical protein
MAQIDAKDALAEARKEISMWRKTCPVCRQPMAKKLPTETVHCPCGKYVWKG